MNNYQNNEPASAGVRRSAPAEACVTLIYYRPSVLEFLSMADFFNCMTPKGVWCAKLCLNKKVDKGKILVVIFETRNTFCGTWYLPHSICPQ